MPSAGWQHDDGSCGTPSLVRSWSWFTCRTSSKSIAWTNTGDCKVKDIDFGDLRIALPAFLTICITPLAHAPQCDARNLADFCSCTGPRASVLLRYSISFGIFVGIASYYVLGGVLWLAEALDAC